MMIEQYLFFHSQQINIKKNKGQDLSHYVNLFDFTKNLHEKKDELFWKNIQLPQGSISNFDYISDIAASVITQFVTTDDGRKKFLGEGLACCKDILSHIGFDQTYTHEFPSLLKAGDENILLVLGCQTRKLIRSRAVAAARLYKNLLEATRKPGNLTVYFSGSSPNKNKPQVTQHEYKELHNYFIEEIGSLLKGGENFVDIQVDPNSHNTRSNIYECIHTHIIPKFRSRKINLFVVSSTFHMIRLSQDLLAELNKSQTRKRLIASDIRIGNIFLVGAETYNSHSDIVEHEKYVKNMFYDITHYFLANGVYARRSR